MENSHDASISANRLLWDGLFLADPQMVARALDQGANPNGRYGETGMKLSRYNHADTPLHGALNPSPTSRKRAHLGRQGVADTSGVSDIITQLIQKGADAGATNAHGKTPLWVMCDSPKLKTSVKTQKLLIQKTKAAGMINAPAINILDTAMHRAGVMEPRTLILMHEAGGDLEARDSRGFTPIMSAFGGLYSDFLTKKPGSLKRPLSVIDTLLKLGANVNARDKNGDSVAEIFDGLPIQFFKRVNFDFSELHPIRQETLLDFKIASLEQNPLNAVSALNDMLDMGMMQSEKPAQGIAHIQRALGSASLSEHHRPILARVLSTLEHMVIERNTTVNVGHHSRLRL